MKERFAAGELDEREFLLRRRIFIRRGKRRDFVENFLERHFRTFGEGVSRVAIRAAKITGGEADKNARQAREGAFALQAEIDFVDDQCFGHPAVNVRWLKLSEKGLVERGGIDRQFETPPIDS